MSSTQSRYPGTHPFDDTPADHRRFFGRREEVEQLYLRVLSVPLLLQFGRSGLGKTSLLQAGLFPRLREKPFLPAIIRLNIDGDPLIAAVTRSLQQACDAEGLEFVPGDTSGVWELLSTTTIWREDLLLTPVLVFDQFEEVFTLRDEAFRHELASELGALATGKPPARLQGKAPAPALKIVISLREDYLGELEAFSAAIPALFHERLRLEPLSEAAAREAIVAPAALEPRPDEPPYASPRFAFDPAALDAMIAELKGQSGVIEPFQLQLLCGHAEAIAMRKGGEPVVLTADDFRGTQQFALVLDRFYVDTLARLSPPSQRKRAALLCEEGLLDGEGHRLMLGERQILTDYRLSRQSLDMLCKARLIRAERRMESTFYEISHDRVAAAVAARRHGRVPKKVRRALWAGGIAATVLLIFLIFWIGTVERQRRAAENERNSAERLLTFMLGEEFMSEVRDTGRSAMLDLVAKQVEQSRIDQRAPATQALALRQRGTVKRLQNDLPGALDDHRKALEIFTSLADPREIARSSQSVGEVLHAQGKLKEAREHYQTSTTHWREVTAQAEATPDDCIALATTLRDAADVEYLMGSWTHTSERLNEAIGIASNVLFGGKGPCAARMDRVEPTPNPRAVAVLSRVANMRARLPGAAEDAAGTAALARYASALRPQSAEARSNAFGTLTARGHSAGTAQDALTDYVAAAEGFNELVRWDGNNVLWARDHAATQLIVAEGMLRCHWDDVQCTPLPTLEDAEAIILESSAAMHALAAADPTNRYHRDDLVWVLRVYAEALAMAGRPQEALQRIREAERMLREIPRDPMDKEWRREESRVLQTAAYIEGRLGSSSAVATADRSIAIARKLTTEHPDNHLFLTQLHDTLATKLRLRANATDAAESESIGTQHAKLLEQQQTKLKEVAETDIRHFNEARRLYDERDYPAAIRELEASERYSREYILLRPAVGEAYDRLRSTYRQLAYVHRDAGNPKAELAALAAAVNASHLAVRLANPENDDIKTLNVQLLQDQFDLCLALFFDKRIDQALAAAREVATAAEQMARISRDPEYLGQLGYAHCQIGIINATTGGGGWEEGLRGGIIHIDAAARALKTNADFFNAAGYCRKFLADQLAAHGRNAEAETELRLALDAYRQAAQLDSTNEESKTAIAEIVQRLPSR